MFEKWIIDWAWISHAIAAAIGSVATAVGGFLIWIFKRRIERKPEHDAIDLATKKVDFRTKQLALWREIEDTGVKLPELADLEQQLTDDTNKTLMELLEMLVNRNIYYTYLACGLFGKQVADMGGERDAFGLFSLEWAQLDLLESYQMLSAFKLVLHSENEDAANYAERLRLNPPGQRITRFINAGEASGDIEKASADALRRSLARSLEITKLNG